MLPARSRVRRRPEFAAVIRGGRRAGSTGLVIHLLPPPADRSIDERARAGFVVGRTVGAAVVRNRVRRRLRHLMAERLPGLPPGSLVVVRALPAAAERSFAQLSVDLDRALRRLTAALVAT